MAGVILLLGCVMVWCVLLLQMSVVGHIGTHREIQLVSRLLKRSPRSLRLLLTRSELYRRHGELGKALLDLRRARKFHPKRPKLYLAFAATYLALKDHRGTGRALARFFALGGSHWYAWRLRAQLRAAQGKHKAALGDLQRALRVARSPELYLERGVLQQRLGRWEDAIKGYREGMKKLGGAVVLRLALLDVLTRRKRYKAALGLVDELLRKLPVKADWKLRRARLYVAMGAHKLARQDRLSALRESEGLLRLRPSALNLLRRAKVLLSLGRTAPALRDLRRARRAAPKLGEIQTWLHRARQQHHKICLERSKRGTNLP